MKGCWELESKRSLYKFFLDRNIPGGCKSAIEKQLEYYEKAISKLQITKNNH